MSTLPYGVPPSGFRLPDGTRVGAVRLQVSDLARSVDYYTRVLGLVVQDEARGRTALGARGDARALLVLETSSGVTAARRGAFGLYHFAVLLPDRAALGRFAAHVSALGLRVGMADHRVSESFYLSDPDNLGIEVYGDRPRHTWQHRHGELAMATDPLDVEDVVSSGRGEPWDGAPAGTIIGHMHLHVGSLAEAEAFYHRALGFDKTVWSYPGALFMAAGGYHHHLGTNTWSPGPAPAPQQAQLLDWELRLPSPADVADAARSLQASGHSLDVSENSVVVADPWGTRVRVCAG